MSDAPTTTRRKPKRKLRKIDAAMRQRIEDAVDALLATLDAIDPDPDLEPSLGYMPSIDRTDMVDVEGDDADGPQLDPAEDGIARRGRAESHKAGSPGRATVRRSRSRQGESAPAARADQAASQGCHARDIGRPR